MGLKGLGRLETRVLPQQIKNQSYAGHCSKKTPLNLKHPAFAPTCSPISCLDLLPETLLPQERKSGKANSFTGKVNLEIGFPAKLRGIAIWAEARKKRKCSNKDRCSRKRIGEDRATGL